MGRVRGLFSSMNTVNVLSLPYNFLNVFFSLAYVLVKVQEVTHRAEKMCANQLLMSQEVRVYSRQLAVPRVGGSKYSQTVAHAGAGGLLGPSLPRRSRVTGHKINVSVLTVVTEVFRETPRSHSQATVDLGGRSPCQGSTSGELLPKEVSS